MIVNLGMSSCTNSRLVLTLTVFWRKKRREGKKRGGEIIQKIWRRCLDKKVQTNATKF